VPACEYRAQDPELAKRRPRCGNAWVWENSRVCARADTLNDVTPTDAELIDESHEHPERFGEIFSRHFAAVFRFVARRVGTGDASDVVSDVFTTAFRIRSRYDHSRANCLPWLYGIAANHVGDRLRKRRHGSRTFLAIASTEAAWDDSADTDDRLVAESIGDQINEALGRLSRRDRETLLLFALEGLTYSEIAHALKIPEGTVGSRLARARRLMREQIVDLEQIADRMNERPGGKEEEDV
jgi:RNA polymerase sigma factor (sigma-70 family)